MATRAEVIAWLDARGWPHDTQELGPERVDVLRKALNVCGHRTRSGTPCAFTPMANGRCKRAGGTARRGIGHPNFQHGQRSKYMPKDLRARYEAALRDSQGLIDLARDLALLEVRVTELLERASAAGGGAGKWERAQREFEALFDALQADRKAEAQRRLDSLRVMLAAGTADASIWLELDGVLELRRKVVDTETRRADKAQDSLRIEQAVAFMRALTYAVREAVAQADISEADRAFILERVAERFSSTVGGSGLALPAGQEAA